MSNLNSRRRQPKGKPVGGQFAEEPKTEPTTALNTHKNVSSRTVAPVLRPQVSIDDLVGMRERGELDEWTDRLRADHDQWFLSQPHRHQTPADSEVGDFIMTSVDVTDFMLRVTQDDEVGSPQTQSGKDPRVVYYLNVAIDRLNQGELDRVTVAQLEQALDTVPIDRLSERQQLLLSTSSNPAVLERFVTTKPWTVNPDSGEDDYYVLGGVSEDVLVNVGANPVCPTHVWEQLPVPARLRVAQSWLRLPQPVLNNLAQDPDPRVRALGLERDEWSE